MLKILAELSDSSIEEQNFGKKDFSVFESVHIHSFDRMHVLHVVNATCVYVMLISNQNCKSKNEQR